MLDELAGALGGDGPDELRGAAALRLRVRLQPAAGVGTRIMPPTYSGNEDGPVYLREERRVEDATMPCVLVDSIASQSNRLEEALLALVRGGDLQIPDIEVDQERFGTHRAIEFSHRIFDAWVEDALLDGKRFGATDVYERLASVINRGVAKPLVERFPVGLLLGCWASRKHNPQGATRIARAVTSEIVGYDALDGERAASKVDLQHISRDVRLLDSAAETARFDVAAVDQRGGKRPSEFGYGNVTPSAAQHGGVTVRFAEQQTVVSLAALRGVRMGELGEGAGSDAASDLAARRLLALLAIAMLEAQVELGWDLRSGCQLVPDREPTLELVSRLGHPVRQAPLVGLGAVAALRAAVAEAKQAGIDWTTEPLKLQASPQQLELLERSLGRPPEESSEG